MAKHKKVTIEPEGNPEPIEATIQPAGEPVPLNVEAPKDDLEVEKPPTVIKPIFVEDKSNLYRDLLLERPGVPTLTNMQEAIRFVEAYQKWNRKVQTAFK